MTRIPYWSLALLVMALFSAPSSAATPAQLIESLTPQQLVKILAECGVSDAKTDKDGDVIVKMHDVTVLVMVATTKFTMLKFKFTVTAKKATLRTVNEWNRDKSFTKAFIDDDGDVAMEMDLDLEGGVADARVRDAISTYQQSLEIFLAKLKALP